MASQIFEEILKEKIDLFKYSFQIHSKSLFEKENKIFHNAEFGSFRENICIDFLKIVVPSRLDFGTGFIISSNNQLTTQCDVVIFDKSSTPLVENYNKHRFFPNETVVGIGEIKSDLTKTKFKEALIKLSVQKSIRFNLRNPSVLKRQPTGIDFNPRLNPYDSIFSFLICNRLDFNLEEIDWENIYSGIDYWHRHNLILSLEDGLFAYKDFAEGRTIMYPFIRGQKLANRILVKDFDQNIHIKTFAGYIFMATTNASIFFPEMTEYFSSTGGINKDMQH